MTRGAFLAPVLVPVNTCFVNLPLAFVQSFLQSPTIADAGSTILKLSWETPNGYIRSVCVGWNGGIVKDRALRSDVIEVPTELACCVGIHHVETMPQSFIEVNVENTLPIARQVNVEPCTPDDWELIQLHTESIEMELLRQMCVVNDKQVSPIWINQNTLIRIQVSLPDEMEYARLTPTSEIIVAPKERPVYTAEHSLSPDLDFKQSLFFMVQKNFQNDLTDQVWVHPESLATLYGDAYSDTPSKAQDDLVVALWIAESKDTTTIEAHNKLLRQQLDCYIARLRGSYGVARGHIFLNAGAAATLGASRSLAMFNKPFCAGSAQLIAITIDAIIDIQYDTKEDNCAEQHKDFSAGSLMKYTVLGGNNKYNLSEDQVIVLDAPARQQQVFEKINQTAGSISALDQSFKLSRATKIYKLLKKAVRPILSCNGSAIRVLLGTKSPGCALMYGERGSGKSTILRTLVHEVQTSSNYLSFAKVVDCRDLRGRKMESVKSQLNELFENSAKLAPTLIVLDNLDALVPEEDESGGVANEQSRQIAELLVILLKQNFYRIGKATAELNASFKLECEIISGLSHRDQQQARKKLLETVGNAMQSKSVAIVAAARSDTNIHKILRTCGLFDRPIKVDLPDTERRAVVIHEMLRMKVNDAKSNGNGAKSSRHIAIDPAIDFGLLASMTEGYNLRDLSSATDRTLHQMLKRSDLEQSSNCSEELYTVNQNDFEKGIHEFRPTALIGVDLFKSSVKWSDVGGLHDVRAVLRDTLELPTRYAKLYDNTPIKLPAGLLLYGPPGCGKTLLASAVAHECGLNFISVKGPEVLNKYIGASEQAIRDLFYRAGSASPSVLFLDEFDSIAPRRGADNTGVTDRMVNQLLTFLDGVEARKGVYVLAATSRPDMIDPALLRPGRLDKSLYCGFPDEDERLDILRAVSKNMKLADEALNFLPVIARASRSTYFTGADLQAIMYSAQLELVHEKLNGSGHNLITKDHVQKSFQNAKPSTSEAARLQFERMYASFSKARKTDFALAEANVSASSDSPKSHFEQRTALA
ncbi:peroxisome biogenesis [Plasmopara halstedii]|uniref:Peroxisomal ATPase PEX1 n=1 Tax=Plasmopara halstedii TaxID=4781 RepID=A0A0P1AYC0_PLAHL|nr:peroxisome biogenesis [Plasmopara halstedii]CEG47464.1 peroxisome biogenesis [Plasmopara halstedii]|eukprot:XP_024583833.1 peroxisome biogenesis [Plasmopara halstedii]